MHLLNFNAAYVNCDAMWLCILEIYNALYFKYTDPAYTSNTVQSIQYRITNYLHSGIPPGASVFGGIVNCATIANGIIKACKDTKLVLPLIVRLEGGCVYKPCPHHLPLPTYLPPSTPSFLLPLPSIR